MAKVSKTEAVKKGVSAKGWDIVYRLMADLPVEKRSFVLLCMARNPVLKKNIPRSEKDRSKIDFYLNIKEDVKDKSVREIMERLKFMELYKEELHVRN
jgi:hypothetical protein